VRPLHNAAALKLMDTEHPPGGDKLYELLDDWLTTPPGQMLLDWEQAQLDRVVADMFGYHAVQLGWPRLDGLRANRMPHRWLLAGTKDRVEKISLLADVHALPFEERSLDLVVLPHTLEFATDPHHTLAEVDRVLMPEGKLVILGFNPASAWGLAQRWGRLRRALNPRRELYLPQAGEFIAWRRLRDWLRLLSFEVEAGRFGIYRPALRTDKWLARWQWMDRLGDHWWPILGAVYVVVAVKRVRGMRLVGLLPAKRSKAAAAPAVAAHGRVRRQP
jgi:SAM-dependent methyltransferase